MDIRTLPALAVIAALLCGCASSSVPLPDTAKLPERRLSSDEQKKKISEMIANAQARQREAATQIETGK
jgi:hypothetical protein